MIETILKYYKPPFKVDEFADIVDGYCETVAKVETPLSFDGRNYKEIVKLNKALNEELCYLLNLAAANQISDNGMAESQ